VKQSEKNINLPVSPDIYKKTKEIFQQYNDKLQEYIDLLLWWNERINLVSRSVSRSRETLREHVIHSLLPVSMGILKNGEIIVDAGTGGGLPGIPLAISSPGIQFVLNDIVIKKTVAVMDMARTLKLENVEIFSASIEEFNSKNPFLLISKHAFQIDDLYKMVEDKPVKKLIFYKGCREALAEIKNIESIEYKTYCFDFGEEYPFYEGKGISVIKKRK